MPSPLSTPGARIEVVAREEWLQREHRRGTRGGAERRRLVRRHVLAAHDDVRVPGRGEVRDAGLARRVGRVRDRTVLEERLVEVRDVVDDDVGVVDRTQRGDLVREVEVTVEGGREREMRAGREVVHELRHRAALVGLPAAREVGLHDHGRGTAARVPDPGQISGCDVGRRVRGRADRLVERIRQDAHRLARTVHRRARPAPWRRS